MLRQVEALEPGLVGELDQLEPVPKQSLRGGARDLLDVGEDAERGSGHETCPFRSEVRSADAEIEPYATAGVVENRSMAKSPSDLIDARIRELDDWRGEMLARLRALVKEADPDVVEEWKWRGTPVWAHDGIICTGETYKNVVKMTFAKGASLEDPSGLFNSSLEGNVRRAIDFHEGDNRRGGAQGARSRSRRSEHVVDGRRGPERPLIPPVPGRISLLQGDI